jgi:hypothetical protein
LLGTLDALICGTNIDTPVKLLKEMDRVTKINGVIWIVSHGKPEHRIKVFL